MTRLLLNRATLGVSSIASAYFVYIFNGSLPTVKVMTEIEGPYEGFYEGLMLSGLFIGALIGSFISYFVVRKPRSSRMIIRIIDSLALIALYLSCISNIWTIIVARIFFGIGGGLTGIILPLYVKETTPVEVYGVMGGFDKLLYKIILISSSSLGSVL